MEKKDTDKLKAIEVTQDFGLPFILGTAVAIIKDCKKVSEASLRRLDHAIMYLTVAKGHIKEVLTVRQMKRG